MTRSIARRRALLAPVILLLCCRSLVARAPAAEPPDEQRQPTRSAVPVEVDPRVELMSVIFRLAGNPEYNQGRVESYTRDVDEHFGPFRDHEVVELARRLRRTRGVSFDAVMSMAVHLDGVDPPGARVPFDPAPAELDGRWGSQNAERFVEAAARFVKDTAFVEFFDEHRPLYERTESRLDAMLRENAELDWFDDFFGSRPEANFTVIPGMLNGGGCYGSRCRLDDDGEQLYCILGVWLTDREGDPRFTADMVGTVVHEFCHSYTNPIVDRHLDELEPAGQKIFPRVESTLRRQAYGQWQTMMYESMVRACVIRYLRKNRGSLSARLAVEEDKKRGFAWIGELSELLAEYEADREQYPTLDAFFPRVVDFFDQHAETLPERPEGFLAEASRWLADRAKKLAEEQAIAARRPKTVSVTPADGSKDVDPALDVIRVVFDRKMADGSWSMVGGGPHFPEIVGKPSYDAARTVWTVRVKLKPNWTYQFMLNSGRFQAFRSAEGVPLAPVRVEFATAEARRADGTAPTDD